MNFRLYFCQKLNNTWIINTLIVFVNCCFCCFSVYCVIHDNVFLSFCSMPISNYSIRLLLLHATQRHVCNKRRFFGHITHQLLYLTLTLLFCHVYRIQVRRAIVHNTMKKTEEMLLKLTNTAPTCLSLRRYCSSHVNLCLEQPFNWQLIYFLLDLRCT